MKIIYSNGTYDSCMKRADGSCVFSGSFAKEYVVSAAEMETLTIGKELSLNARCVDLVYNKDDGEFVLTGPIVTSIVEDD